MKIKLLAIGKTDNKNLQQFIATYENRLAHYTNFVFEIIPDIKNTKNITKNQQKEKEAILLLNRIQPSDYVIVMDEKGKEFRSVEFARFLQKKMNSGMKQLVLIIGGPYGFSESVYQRASEKLSLSKMTFSHQMIRLFLLEQLYRGFTILKNEPYHHE